MVRGPLQTSRGRAEASFPNSTARAVSSEVLNPESFTQPPSGLRRSSQGQKCDLAGGRFLAETGIRRWITAPPSEMAKKVNSLQILRPI